MKHHKKLMKSTAEGGWPWPLSKQEAAARVKQYRPLINNAKTIASLPNGFGQPDEVSGNAKTEPNRCYKPLRRLSPAAA